MVNLINFKSTQTIESATVPGVKFTVRRLARIHTAKRDLSILDDLCEYRAACQRAAQVLRGAGYTVAEDGTYTRNSQDPISPAVESEISDLDDKIVTLLHSVIIPAALKASLLSIEGVTQEDGSPVTTAAALLEGGPQVNELVEEIYKCSEKANQVSAEEKEMLKVAA